MLDIDADCHSKSVRSLALAAFFLVGATTSVYGLAWVRTAGQFFGSSVAITSMIAVCSAGGFAFGALLFGRLGGSRRNPLRVAGILQIGLACIALFFPELLSIVDRIDSAIFGSLEPGRHSAGLLRLGEFVVLFAIPAALVGGSFPLIAEVLIARHRVTQGISRAFATVAAGAGAGFFVAVFLLFPAAGTRVTTLACAVVTLATGILCLATGRPLRDTEDGGHDLPHGEGAEIAEASGSGLSGVAPVILLTVIAITGAVALIFLVTWERVGTLVLGPNVYTHAVIFTLFFCGIALGSYLASLLPSRFQDRISGLGMLLIGIALAGLLAVSLFGRLPGLFLKAYSGWQGSWPRQIGSEFGLGLLIILPGATLLGALFPLACGAVVWTTRSVRAAMRWTQVSGVLGALIGILLARFVFIPGCGIQGTAVLASIVSVVAGLVVTGLPVPEPNRRAQYTVGILLAAACLAVWIGLPQWDPALMTSGVSIYAPRYVYVPSFDALVQQPEIVYYAEAPDHVVAVTRVGERRGLSLDGRIDATNTGDLSTQILVGSLPILLHADPKTVLVLDHSSVITLGSVLEHDVRNVLRTRELVGLRGAGAALSGAYHASQTDHRLGSWPYDARYSLRREDSCYDCIVSRPPPPWISGGGELSSRDFLLLCRERLAEGGMMSQRIQLHSISQRDLEIAVRTFLSVFHSVSVWLPSESELILIGSADPVRIDDGVLAERLAEPKVAKEMTRIGIEDETDLLSYFVCAGTESLAFVSIDGPVYTNDNNLLGFSMPRSLYDNAGLSNLLLVARARSDPRGAVVEVALERRDYVEAVLTPKLRARRLALGARNSEVEAGPDAALEAARRAREFNPRDPFARRIMTRLLWQKGDWQLDGGHLDEAEASYHECLEVNPESAMAHQGLALVHLRREDLARAAEEAKAALALEPTLARSHCALGSALGKMGDAAGAVRFLERAVELEPYSVEARNVLGIAYAAAGRLEDAAAQWERVLKVDPENTLAKEGLTRVRRRMR